MIKRVDFRQFGLKVKGLLFLVIVRIDVVQTSRPVENRRTELFAQRSTPYLLIL